MPNFTFDPKISLGQVVTWAIILVTVTAAWQSLSGRVGSLETNDGRQDSRLGVLSDTVGDIRNTLTEQGVDIRYIRSFVEDERRNARAALNSP
jgi:hypothetical protein